MYNYNTKSCKKTVYGSKQCGLRTVERAGVAVPTDRGHCSSSDASRASCKGRWWKKEKGSRINTHNMLSLLGKAKQKAESLWVMRQQESMGVYRKHGSNLEKCHQCQNHRCDSGAASRPLNLTWAIKAFRVVLLRVFLSVFMLPLRAYFLFICDKRPVSSASCKAPSISASLLNHIPSSFSLPWLLLRGSVVIPGSIRLRLSLTGYGVTPSCRYVAAPE